MAGLQADVYSNDQVEAWLERIGLPKAFRPEHVPGKDLEALAKLQRHHLAAVPFEDCEIHYSKHHTITLEPSALFARVVNRKHGGYCMQGNSLLEHMLRALGFTLFSTGARGRNRQHGIPYGPFLGWVHQVIIVTLADGNRWMVDVAFGGDGPTRPLPLQENTVIQNLGPQNSRLTRRSFGHDANQKAWIYQVQYAVDEEWHDAYCFHEVEFLPQDFGVISYWTSTNEASYMTKTVIAARVILEGEEIVGRYTLAHNMVKRNMYGNVEVVMECRNEEERIDALDKYFGVKLNEEEKNAIQGRPGELKE